MFDDELAKVPTQPPRSLTLLPGLRVRSVFSGISLSGPLTIISFFSLFPLLILFSGPEGRLAFGNTGLAQGRVIKVSNSDSPSQTRRVLTYAFTPPGNRGEYRSTSSVDQSSVYFSINAGNSVPIKYLISDPAISVIAGDRNSEPPYFLFLFFPFFGLLIFAPVFAPVFRELLRARRIVKNGFITQGSIVFVRRRIRGWPVWPDLAAFDVTVSYQTPSGVSAEAKAWCNNEWLVHNLPPDCTVHIAIIPSRPGRGALLEAFVR